METVVRLSGVPELALEKLVSSGYFSSKSDALRAGILELNQKYDLVKYEDVLDELAAKKMERLDKEVDAGKRKMTTLDELLAEEGLTRADLDKIKD